MTQEEKAKAYDEALKQAKKFHTPDSNNSNLKAVLELIFPELKPSEDEERLINTSISFLKDFADKGYENAVECIDWLKSKINGTSTNAK